MMRSRLLRLGNIVFWALVVAGALKYVVPKWREFGLASRLSEMDPWWLAGGVLVLLLQYLTVFALWRLAIRILDESAPTDGLYKAFALSLLPKYVPGKVLGVGVRTRLAALSGIPYPVLVSSLLWEIGLSLGAAMIITTLGIVANISHELHPPPRWPAAASAAAGILGIATLLVPRARSLVANLLNPGAALRQPRMFAALVLGYLGTWGISTVAHWMLAQAIIPFGVHQAVPLLVALATSWTLGVLSVFAPAGFGVREGVLFLFARGVIGAPAALLFVTVSRVAMLLVEVLLTISALVLSRSPTKASL